MKVLGYLSVAMLVVGIVGCSGDAGSKEAIPAKNPAPSPGAAGSGANTSAGGAASGGSSAATVD